MPLRSIEIHSKFDISLSALVPWRLRRIQLDLLPERRLRFDRTAESCERIAAMELQALKHVPMLRLANRSGTIEIAGDGTKEQAGPVPATGERPRAPGDDRFHAVLDREAAYEGDARRAHPPGPAGSAGAGSAGTGSAGAGLTSGVAGSLSGWIVTTREPVFLDTKAEIDAFA